MSSSPSFSVSSFSSVPSSLVAPLREEECRPSGSLGDQSSPQSLSSGIMTGADVKALQALEVMKSYHDFDSTVNLESLHDARQSPNRRGAPRSCFLGPSFNPTTPPAPCAKSGSTSEVQEIPDKEATSRLSRGEARGATKIPHKRRAEDPIGQKKRDRRKLHHKADRSAAKGKGPIDTTEEPPASR
ncbi:hypothetical protein B296_00000137 [Ensete ventricosum]|uniref:Uncharacterized protein n=1 Tax=Ensete ventricosum TaxID=4639 RepID=A0A427B6W4_ENSVE|nr:hypothetical protein B296_00000137 [Ensete ventricosum]